MEKDRLQILRRLRVIDDEASIPIAARTLRRPVLAADECDAGIDDDAFVVNTLLNAKTIDGVDACLLQSRVRFVSASCVLLPLNDVPRASRDTGHR
jgi:hypothetical protein